MPKLNELVAAVYSAKSWPEVTAAVGKVCLGIEFLVEQGLKDDTAKYIREEHAKLKVYKPSWAKEGQTVRDADSLLIAAGFMAPKVEESQKFKQLEGKIDQLIAVIAEMQKQLDAVCETWGGEAVTREVVEEAPV